MTDAERTPVIVGVGQINDRPADPHAGLDSLGLMEAALREADADAGGGWLRDIDSLAIIDQISFRRDNPLVAKLVASLGASPRHAEQGTYPGGNTPILRLNEAANRIGAGEAKICAVVGGEALRTAAQRKALAKGTPVKEQNPMRGRRDRPALTYLDRYGLFAPVEIYPLYENAMRAAYGQTLAEGQRETGEIWSRMSQVAAENEGAWIREAAHAGTIVEPARKNRPIAFPYTKLMVANASVNQGAGFIVASLAEARRRGIPDERLIHVGNGAAAQESDDILRRDRYDHSASMAVSLERALELNGVEATRLDVVELYSCFPCVPKMARRILGWPVERAATVSGGLTFGGGPIANYMSHAVVQMVRRLRGGARIGLLFANGGLATQNHTILLSAARLPGVSFPRNFDFQDEAESRRGEQPDLVPDYVGPATIETYTVFFDHDGAARGGVIVARTPAGGRLLARVRADDTACIDFLTDGKAEPVGRTGTVVADGDARVWDQTPTHHKEAAAVGGSWSE